MDYTDRVNARAGVNIKTKEEETRHRKQRIKKLLTEITDISQDPNVRKNHLGKYECLLCYSIHNTESSYLIHSKGKKHTTNLNSKIDVIKSKSIGSTKLAIPKYVIRSVIDGKYKGWLIQLNYTKSAVPPFYKFISSLEQAIESFDAQAAYIVFICDGYENIGFKFPNFTIRKENFIEYFDIKKRKFFLQFFIDEN
ncbi:Splicing factor 3A subunit 2 [Astathelohania contejeani]|uniref:Splicing factor 3A subunit 2 n=1 Tax=Astathelohania contejeani TaxID=164912 RepID=A0ABQ7HWC7_9MICR|nr:Splicing factor 3A subunit 2 [Thelohania contejeani]